MERQSNETVSREERNFDYLFSVRPLMHSARDRKERLKPLCAQSITNRFFMSRSGLQREPGRGRGDGLIAASSMDAEAVISDTVLPKWLVRHSFALWVPRGHVA